jgi:hypothetical protein
LRFKPRSKSSTYAAQPGALARYVRTYPNDNKYIEIEWLDPIDTGLRHNQMDGGYYTEDFVHSDQNNLENAILSAINQLRERR